jgi:LAS superfamily LD-carboxypeptidase LdcB
MDLKKYLTQVQDFATDLVSRNNLLNDLYQEVIEMMLHDDKEPPKEAVVLKVLSNTQTADELKEGNEQYYTAVLRIPKLHDCLPDPARKIKNSTNGEINKIIQCHTVCFSREKLSSVDGSGNPSPAPKVGDVVVLDFVDGIPRFGAKIRYDINYTGLSFLSENSEDQEKPATSSSLDDIMGTAEIKSLKDLLGKEGKQIAKESLEAASRNPALTGKKITNGKLPAEALATIPGLKDLSKRPVQFLAEVADEFLQLYNDFEAHFGYKLEITDSYRSYQRQEDTKKNYTAKGEGHLAATPGYSPHGWALAFDCNTYGQDGKNGFDGEVYKWLFKNAPKRGFWNPSWLQKGAKSRKDPTKSTEEPWHWEVVNKSQYIKVFNGIESEQAE